MTSLFDMNLNGNYTSCMTGIAVPSEMWAPEHPRKNEACVQFVVGANKTALVSSFCNSKALLVCEVAILLLFIYFYFQDGQYHYQYISLKR
jgi:hypothetical protein